MKIHGGQIPAGAVREKAVVRISRPGGGFRGAALEESRQCRIPVTDATHCGRRVSASEGEGTAEFVGRAWIIAPRAWPRADVLEHDGAARDLPLEAA